MREVIGRWGKRMIMLSVLMVLAVLGVRHLKQESEAGQQAAAQIETKIALEKIIQVSRMSTYEVIYNGVVRVENEKKPDKVDYYVSYEAVIKAGCDFQQITYEISEEQKKLKITLPEIMVQDVNVDISSLDFLFMNDKVNSGTITGEAYRLCLVDAQNAGAAETAIYELARQNAVNALKAMVSPFMEQLWSGYSLIIE